MIGRARFWLLALVVATLLPGLQARGAEEGPLSLENIRQLRLKRVPVKKIGEAIEARGLGFAIDDDAAKKLKALGFHPKFVAQLKEKYAAGQGMVQPNGGADNGPADQAIAAAKGKPRVLDAQTESGYKAMSERIEKISKASGIPVKPHQAKHTTIIANPRIAGMFVPDVEKLEKMIAARFPEPIATGADLRANNIALLETRYEYENWVKALFQVHQGEGFQFNSPDPLASALKTNAIFVNGIFSVCLEGMPAEQARRAVAFGVGYQYFRQLTNDKSPAALQTGFGNITEAMMMGEPGTTVLSGYSDRKLGAAPARWSDIVRQQFAENQVGSLANVLVYSTDSMQLPQYALAWSLTSLLASEPRNFGELVTKLGEGTPAADAVEAVYGVKDEQALEIWRKQAGGAR